MTIKTSNLKLPDNPKWKKIGDICIYTLPQLLILIVALPITDNQKVWLQTGTGCFLVIIKAISKFTSDISYDTDITNN